jgi:HPt (histidine-containing phosphotransfer) domain-containing protein
MSSQPVLDPAVIDTLRQLTVPGEPDVLEEVLKLFLEEAPARLSKLRNAWEARDIQSVQRMAHSLKGSAGNIGATALFEICKQLDSAGRPAVVVDTGSLIDALDTEYRKVEEEIHRITGA